MAQATFKVVTPGLALLSPVLPFHPGRLFQPEAVPKPQAWCCWSLLGCLSPLAISRVEIDFYGHTLTYPACGVQRWCPPVFPVISSSETTPFVTPQCSAWPGELLGQ